MAQLLYAGRYISVFKHNSGVEYIECENGAVCVALDNNENVLLIKEISHVPGSDNSLLLPGGIIEAQEAGATAANRELQEEIGYKAGRIDFLGTLRPWKYLDAKLLVYLARDLTESRLQGDENFEIVVVPVPLVSFEDFMQRGELQESSAVAALFMARSFIQNRG